MHRNRPGSGGVEAARVASIEEIKAPLRFTECTGRRFQIAPFRCYARDPAAPLFGSCFSNCHRIACIICGERHPGHGRLALTAAAGTGRSFAHF
jgi:hypothetical protein